SYREHFKPSETLPEPYAILAVAAIAAETDAEAERIAASAYLHYVRRSKGEFEPLASPEEAAAYSYTPIVRDRIERHRERLVVGSGDSVKRRLLSLVEATRADELMITTMTYSHTARRHSYEILADAFGIAAAAGPLSRASVEAPL
ncbi:MAG: hypothetical protein WB444_07900, partial [Gallionella sp.]